MIRARSKNNNKLIYTVLLLICVVGFWVFENFYTPGRMMSAKDPILSRILRFAPNRPIGVITSARAMTVGIFVRLGIVGFLSKPITKLFILVILVLKTEILMQVFGIA